MTYTLTEAQQALIDQYVKQGYTQVFYDAKTNVLTPAYHDWILEFVIEVLELQALHN